MDVVDAMNPAPDNNNYIPLTGLNSPAARAIMGPAPPVGWRIFAQRRGMDMASSLTKRMIMDSLMKLLDERPLNKVSIKDIGNRIKSLTK